MSKENLSRSRSENYPLWRRKMIAAGMVVVAAATAGCGTNETKQAAEQEERRALAEVVDPNPQEPQEQMAARGNVFPGSVQIPESVTRRKQPVLITPSAEQPYDNRIQSGEAEYTEYREPMTLENDDGFWLGALPEGANELSDMEWALLRQDTVKRMQFWSKSGLGPVRYHETKGLVPTYTVEIDIDRDDATLSTQSGREIAESYSIAEEDVFAAMAKEGYTQQETWTDTFPGSWKR